MPPRVNRPALPLRPLVAFLLNAGACGGIVTGVGNDASTDLGSPPVPYYYDGALGAGGELIGSSSGAGGGAMSKSSSPGACPASCRANYECANCQSPAGSQACCVMGICAQTLIRDNVCLPDAGISVPALCPDSCQVDSDCTSCGIPAGTTAKNCCVQHICAMMLMCPSRDSGGDAKLDAANGNE